MNAHAITRRRFIQTAAVAASCSISLTAIRGQQAIAVRPNVATFDQTSQNMVTYANAVKEMRARSGMNPLDPLGWTFWANIHGTPPSEPNFHETWNQCDHGTRWFFPWHRGYLLFFEKIIRKVSGDNAFVLPYWKWDDSTTRSLPGLFRMSMDPTFKELFHPRFSWINNGDSLPDEPFDVDLPNAMGETSFDRVSSFEPGFSLSLDGSPHGPVHTRTGGEMRSIQTSARDPIFWLHHANVDRLWNRWLDQGMGRKNPTDLEWLDTPLRSNGDKKPIRFPDESGAIVQLTVKEVLDMAKASYRYDDDSVPPASPLTAAASGPQPMRQDSVSVGSASNNLFALSDQKSSVAVSLGAIGSGHLSTTVKRMMAANASPKQNRIILELQGVQVAAIDPEVDYAVYIRPKGSNEAGQYVGSLNFFSVHDHKKPGMTAHGAGNAMEAPPKFDVSYNISKAVRKLSNDGDKAISDLEVIFQPSKRPENAKPLPKIGFERIVVQALR